MRTSLPLRHLRLPPGWARAVAAGLLAGAAGAVVLWWVTDAVAAFVYRLHNDRVMGLWVFAAIALGVLVVESGGRAWAAVSFAILVGALPMLQLHVMHQDVFHQRGRVERAVVVAETEQGALGGVDYRYELRALDGSPAGPVEAGSRRLRVGSTVTVTVDPGHEVATVLGSRSGAASTSRTLECAVESAAGVIALWLGTSWALRRARASGDVG